MTKPKFAHNECVKCKAKWDDLPGIKAIHYGGCPNCGSLYWTWLNADEFQKGKTQATQVPLPEDKEAVHKQDSGKNLLR